VTAGAGEPMHYVLPSQLNGVCGQTPGLATRDLAYVTCPGCAALIHSGLQALGAVLVEHARVGVIIAGRDQLVDMTCGRCGRQGVFLARSADAAQRATRMQRMGFVMVCDGCEP